MDVLAKIPKFPKFRKLKISDAPVFFEMLKKHPPLISEYTFTNLFSWMHYYDFEISNIDNTILVYTKAYGEGGIYPPIGKWDKDLLVYVLKEITSQGIGTFLHCADEKMAQALLPYKNEIDIEEELDQFDYVYKREDLINLPGKKLQRKRNLINQFNNKYDVKIEALTTKTVKEVIDFSHDWCRTRECEKDPGLKREACAVFKMLSYFEALRLEGILVRDEKGIIGITMGEALNKDTYVIHVEKCNDKYKGAYQYINQKFCTLIDSKFHFINREQDLGIEGLRKAKQSYNPLKMEKKYVVHLKNSC